MELLIIWLIFAVWAGVWASSKGYSGLGWGLLGLIFGVFAVIIVAFKPKKEA